MNQTTANPKTDSLDSMTNRTEAVCHWLKRSYEISQEWNKVAMEIYLQSQGDSVLARTVMASRVRSHFITDKPQTETIRRWNKGHTEIEDVTITPPKVIESNAAYIDWFYVADYLLLCCGTTRDEFDDVNTVRRAQFRSLLQSYLLRSYVIEAIELMEQDSSLSNDQIVEQLKMKAKNEESQPSLATVKEAKRWMRAAEMPTNVIRPEAPAEVELYQSLYFK